MNRIVLLGLALVALAAAQYNEAPTSSCAATLCQVGSVCVEEGGQARCVAPPAPGLMDNCTVQFEEWRQCGTCEATCENKNPFCNKMCQPGRCMCRQGFFRSKEGQCVTENDCDSAAITPKPTTCTRANEEYRECASACEPTCKTKDQERACIAMCKPPACQCKVGFFRADNGDCVLAEKCPSRDTPVTSAPSDPKCKKNEQFNSCASMCEPQCGQYGPIPCILMCGPAKCQCTSGFYRNSNGDCVTREECPKNQSSSTPTPQSCKKNQVWSECSTMCAPRCGDKEVRPCMAMCGPAKCECARGFFLDNHGECVTKAECDAQAATPKTPSQADCNPNELFRECSTQCEEKCGEALTRACPASCGPPKCQCDNGFFRNSVGDCVSKDDCELDVPITCANIDCISGMSCEMQNGKPTCVNKNGGLTCATVKCAGGNRCEITPEGTPKCIPITISPCASKNCGIAMKCVEEAGQAKCAPLLPADGPSCNTVKCSAGHHCAISPEGTTSCIPNLTCANVRCAGPCTDTPTGPKCGPRPQVLPISVGPTANPGCPINEEIRDCTNKCNEPFCGDENFARRCAQVCLTPECECIEGFVRDGKKGCVKREECTKKKDEEAISPCAHKNCGIAMRCVDQGGKAMCVPLFSAPRSFPSLPDSCEQVKCLGGGTCVMEEVKCISGPCKPVPKCRGDSSSVAVAPIVAASEPVSSVDPNGELNDGYGSVYQPFADDCSQLKCKEGEECTMERIPCFAAPCKKGAVCRPSNKVCRKEHEVWDQCFHGCGPTCQNREPTCTEQCGPGGCICDTFYIRDEVSGNCVRLEDCPDSSDVPIEKPRALTITERRKFSSFNNPSISSFGPPSPPPPPTCENFECPAGQMCTLPPMACPVPPCTRRPTCVVDPKTLSNCATSTCPVGQICKMVQVQCFVPPCYPVPECQRDPNYIPGDEDVPSCEGHYCPAGEKCQLQEVICVRAPCYPIPNCVPDVEMNPPSCVLPCPLGQSCVLETVFCKKAPCPKRPTCRLLQVDPVPQTCAAVTCLFGETCVEETIPCFVAPCPVRAICKPMSKTCMKKNEVWSQCFTGCEATCQERIKACTLQCGPGGCQCDSGFIRDQRTGECVPESECPNQCLANEKYDGCFHGCEATCDQPNPSCTEQCGPGGCRCADGFVRDTRSKRCVQQSACRRRTYG